MVVAKKILRIFHVAEARSSDFLNSTKIIVSAEEK